MPSLAERLREMGATGGNTEGVKISLQSHQPLKTFFSTAMSPMTSSARKPISENLAFLNF